MAWREATVSEDHITSIFMVRVNQVRNQQKQVEKMSPAGFCWFLLGIHIIAEDEVGIFL